MRVMTVVEVAVAVLVGVVARGLLQFNQVVRRSHHQHLRKD